MKGTFKHTLLTFFLMTVALFGCSEDSSLVGPESDEPELTGPLSAPSLLSSASEGVLSIDYDVDNNNYYVVLNNGGSIDVYYGQHGSWKKLQENRDIDNRYSPSDFVDFAIGGEPGEAMFGVAIGNKPDYKIAWRTYAPRCTSINAREFYDKPYFGDGKPVAIGDLEECLAIEYDKDNNTYVVVGKGPNNQIDVYYGQHKNWKKLQENRDIDNRYTPGQFVDFAIGAGNAMFGVAIGNVDDYKVGFRMYEPRCTSINTREFSNKPWFGDGKPAAIGTLVSCLSIDYDRVNDNYYVVGEGPDGEIDVWYGQHKSWTQLQENRDIDNRYSPSEFVDFALGDGEAMFGVGVGNKDGLPTSINAREFYNKPYFGDGKPQQIN